MKKISAIPELFFQNNQSLKVARPVLQRFGQVGRSNVVAASQVGDRACQFQHTVIGARGELKLGHSGFH